MSEDHDDSKSTVSAETALRDIRPEHLVVGDRLLRRVAHLTGRPRKVRRAPDADARQYARRVSEIAEEFVAEDPVVKAAGEVHDRDDPEVFDRAILELARESAGLAFERQKALLAGKDFAQICSRRVESLGRLASVVALRARIGAEGQLDPTNPKFQKLVDYFMSEMAEAARETLGSGAETFLARYRDLLEGWEDRV